MIFYKLKTKHLVRSCISVICLQVGSIGCVYPENVVPYTKFDKIAIDHAVMVFHAHTQVTNQETFDLTKPTVRKIPKYLDPLRRISALHLAKPKELVQGWEFKLFTGKTGSRKKPQISMLGYLAIHREQKIIVLAFRGSRNAADWHNNSRLTIKKSSRLAYQGYLHGGYIDRFDQLVDGLDDLLKSCINNVPGIEGYTLIVCGHSLGGAMATISAAYIVGHTLYKKYFTKKNTYLMTFGAPHVGIRYQNHDFGQWMENHMQHIRRFERATDPAPLLTHVCKIVAPKSKKHGRLAISAKPSPVGKRIKLPSYNDPYILFHQAHDIRKYRKAIYEKLQISYKPLFLRPIPKEMRAKHDV